MRVLIKQPDPEEDIIQDRIYIIFIFTKPPLTRLIKNIIEYKIFLIKYII